MNEHRKSDKPVVATKPANKAVKAVAEPVEPRSLAKGKVWEGTNEQEKGTKAVPKNRRGENYQVLSSSVVSSYFGE